MTAVPNLKPVPASAEREPSGRYSGWRLLLEGLTGQRGWSRAWAKAAPRPRYRVVIVGGGGHGLATAYYLASEYGKEGYRSLSQPSAARASRRCGT